MKTSQGKQNPRKGSLTDVTKSPLQLKLNLVLTLNKGDETNCEFSLIPDKGTRHWTSLLGPRFLRSIQLKFSIGTGDLETDLCLSRG